MRKRNKVKQLNRVTSHRHAMMRNMVTSLFEHERIITTRAKGKVLRTYAEKLITRAKKNLAEDIKPESALHNRRELLRHVRNEEIVIKLFSDIAPRFKERPGGYIRMVHLPERQSDSSQMSIVELVEKKEKSRKAPPVKGKKATVKEKDARGKDAKGKEVKGKEKEVKKKEKTEGKWYDRFKRKKTGNPDL